MVMPILASSHQKLSCVVQDLRTDPGKCCFIHSAVVMLATLEVEAAAEENMRLQRARALLLLLLLLLLVVLSACGSRSIL